MSIGKLAGRAAGVAAGAVGEVFDGGGYPETEYGLAALLFTRIVSSERDKDGKDRAYYLDLMRACLQAVRPAQADK